MKRVKTRYTDCEDVEQEDEDEREASYSNSASDSSSERRELETEKAENAEILKEKARIAKAQAKEEQKDGAHKKKSRPKKSTNALGPRHVPSPARKRSVQKKADSDLDASLGVETPDFISSLVIF